MYFFLWLCQGRNTEKRDLRVLNTIKYKKIIIKLIFKWNIKVKNIHKTSNTIVSIFSTQNIAKSVLSYIQKRNYNENHYIYSPQWSLPMGYIIHTFLTNKSCLYIQDGIRYFEPSSESIVHDYPDCKSIFLKYVPKVLTNLLD